MKLKKVVVPAVIAKTQEELNESINKVKEFVSLIQLDVMDGRFVPNTSIDFDFIVPKTRCHFEAHLMIEDPRSWIIHHGVKVDSVLVQIESCEEPKEIITLVKNQKKKIGFVLNPGTPITSIEDYLDVIDQVLIMTVHPGFYGSTFLPEVLSKISELRRMKPLLNIEVDGGVTPDTIGLVDTAGANMFVSGSFILKSPDVNAAITRLRKMVGA